jgi:hypothetical protein
MKLRFGLKSGGIVVAAIAVALAFVFAPFVHEVRNKQGTLISRFYVKRNHKLDLIHHGTATWYYPSGAPFCEREMWGQGVSEESKISPAMGKFPIVMQSISSHAIHIGESHWSEARYWLPDGKSCTCEEFHNPLRISLADQKAG